MKPLLEAFNLKKKNTRIPIWLMRQAGRYMNEYQTIRKNFKSFLDLCLNSQAASEVTMQPIKKFGMDGAILFSDILLVPYALGLNVTFEEGNGPKIKGFTSSKNLKLNTQIFDPIFSTVKLVKKKLDSEYTDVSLIGFAGAPWTVFCYIIQGEGSKDFSEAKKFIYSFPKESEQLIEIIVNATIYYLSGQIDSGAEIIKIFDSWSGLVPYHLFDKLIINPTKKIVNSIKNKYPNIPIIGFPKGSMALLYEYSSNTNVDCIAIDSTISGKKAVDCINKEIVLQGNMDNALLFGTKSDISKSVKKIIDEFNDANFIFNLGHGVLQKTPVENVEYLVNLVKEYKR